MKIDSVTKNVLMWLLLFFLVPAYGYVMVMAYPVLVGDDTSSPIFLGRGLLYLVIMFPPMGLLLIGWSLLRKKVVGK